MNGKSAQRITDVYPFGGKCAINVDFQQKEFRVCWSGNWLEPPDLADFPSSAVVSGASIEQIPHSQAVEAVWLASRALKYGADSHIRLLEHCRDNFPICKVAIDERQRQLVSEEFTLLQYLSTQSPTARIVRTLPKPLQDQDGIFGYQMERLTGITFEELADNYEELLGVVQELHEAGVVHYDLSWTNIMLGNDGKITLIDFGRAGRLGEPVPLNKHRGLRRQGNLTYSPSLDFEILQELQR
ncbi:hypothetical protein B0T10DRAFT_502789 [Thelonectria olida]|uniref:EKC/KEOPS complex subunit BUD32 n=1 Tax=Thelonectria olida TaxID=1576542 RepID=A0A9P8VNK7_9HYPO|nr:hypothetical protein B0T10DRAFT_502789 [Thelonectria olida]